MLRIVVESDNVKSARSLVSAAIENEARILKIGIEKTKRNLAELEKKFKMDTASFYEKFSAGKMGDDSEFIRWAGEYETLLRLEKDNEEVAGAVIC